MKVAILLNALAGQLVNQSCEERAQEILAACRAANIEATAHLCRAAQLTATARALARRGWFDAIVAAGGDGTVSAVAAGLVGTDVPLAVIPLGTLNHFSKDLGIRDLESAIAAIAAGHTKRVDVGEVNGKTFINNSSIGLYPEMVIQRDRLRKRSKWLAVLRASLRTLLRFPLLHVAIALANTVMSARVPFVMIGNNEYAIGVRELGSRERLDAGQLSVYTIRATSRWRMFASMIHALFR